MGKMQRDKGARIEREIVSEFRKIGLWAEKVPLSGAAGGSFAGDILVEDYTVEVKARKDGTGFKLLYRWLGDNDILVCKQDRTEPLVVMTIQTLGNILDVHGPHPSPRMEKHFDLECYHTPPPPKEQPKPEYEPLGLTTEELDELGRELEEEEKISMKYVSAKMKSEKEQPKSEYERPFMTAEELDELGSRLMEYVAAETKSKKERDL